MATKKKLLQAAAGSAGGAAALNVEDVFSTYVYEGNGASHVIDNGINLGQSYGSGGIDTSLKAESAVIVNGDADFGYGTGDFTIELWVWINKLYDFINIWDQRTATQDANTASPIIYSSDSGAVFYYQSGNTRISGGNGSLSEGAWNHVALTRNGGSTKLFANGTQVGSTYSDSTNYVAPVSDWSFGGSLEQSLNNVDGYVSNARVVKGTAVYTGNFTVPTSELTNITNTVLLTAQGSTPLVDNSSSSHTVTTNGGAKASTFGPFDAAEAGEGGLVWLKKRSAIDNHLLFDTDRGVTDKLETNTTDAESSDIDTLTSFNSNGFNIGADTEINSGLNDYVSWTFRKAPKFFDVVTYTGTGSAMTIDHNLGQVPGMIIVKSTSATYNWAVWHREFTGTTDYIVLNSSNAKTDSASVFGDGGQALTPTSTQFFVGGNNQVSGEVGGTYVAYLFAHNDGDGEFGPDGDADIIKCGSYTGNGSTTGPEIDLGFEPQWVLVKCATAGGSSPAYEWYLMDTMRGMTGESDTWITVNSSVAESTATYSYVKPEPNGFKIQSGQSRVNASGETYIYIAIRRGPMAVPTDATEVFDVNFQDATAPSFDTGFNVDFGLRLYRPGGTPYAASRLTGTERIGTNSSGSATSSASFVWDYQDGWGDMGITTSDVVAMSWQRAPSFFDVVNYVGNSSPTVQTIQHRGLGVAPEMIWIKNRDGVYSWRVYHKDIGATKFLELDTTDAAATSSSVWYNTEPTDSEFYVGISNAVSQTGSNHIAYLFASLDGVSKVGSFSHTNGGGDTNVDCGFSSGARFVLYKQYDSTGSWYVLDSERGIVAGNDPALLLNSTAAEDSSFDQIDPYSSGFTIPSDGVGTGDYIFYAIA